MAKITLKDIADRVGTSVSTVSRVINKNDVKAASPETVNEIYSVMNQLGYTTVRNQQSQFSAQNLRVGVILGSSSENKYTHSYYSVIFEEIERNICLAEGMIDFYYTLEEIMNSSTVYNSIMASESEALIIVDENRQPILNDIKKKYKHIVNIGINDIQCPNDIITADMYDATKTAIAALIKSGRNNIMLMGGCGALGVLNSDLCVKGLIDGRFLAYRDALAENNIELSKNLIYDASWDGQMAFEILESCIKKDIKFDAIFSADDMMAMGCLRALHNHNIKVPADVAVIGFDNLEIAALSSPPLSTLNVPREDIGKVAVSVLLMRTAGMLGKPVKVVLPIEYVMRETCGLC